MSKRRAVILSVTVEGLTQAETARCTGCRSRGVAAVGPLPRPRVTPRSSPGPGGRTTSPTAIDAEVVELIVNLRAELTARVSTPGPPRSPGTSRPPRHRWCRSRRSAAVSSPPGSITPEPKKRPKSSYIRFEADLPNECWQSDFTHWRLADGTDTEILTWLDDHSRYALSVTAHRPVTGTIVVDTFLETAADTGLSRRRC